MGKDVDIFGEAFRDFMAGRVDAFIGVAIDRTRQDDLPVAYFFREYGHMPEWERLVMDRCRGRVLDAGAGAGAHALELQKRGLEVTAIDTSPGAVQVIKQRGIEKAYCEDFFRFGQSGFDNILFLMNGIGMAGNLDRLPSLLHRARGMLQPGGEVFLESTDLIYMYEQEDGSFLIPAGRHYYGEVSYRLTYKEKKAAAFPWLFVDPDNLMQAASQTGFDTEILWTGKSRNYIARLF
jgi:SAM-dependent methyltransferase